MEDHRSAWSGAAGVVATLAGGGAIAWLVAASTKGTELPTWPVFPFAAVAVVGLYGVLAPLRSWWPWSRSGNAESLAAEADRRADTLTAVLELEANIEDFRHRVVDGLDATPPKYWGHLLASDVWEKHRQTLARRYADIYKEVADTYRAANAINERVSLDKLGRPIPPSEDRQWFLDKVHGEMAHASQLLRNRRPR